MIIIKLIIAKIVLFSKILYDFIIIWSYDYIIKNYRSKLIIKMLN